MTNLDIARTLDKLAFFMALKEDNEFKINACLKAARSVRDCPQEVEDLLLAGESLTRIDGVGKILAKKIEDLVIFGEIRALTELLREFPETLYEINQIRGVGARTILKIWQEHGIVSMDGLGRHLRGGGRLNLPPHTEQRIREFFVT